LVENARGINATERIRRRGKGAPCFDRLNDTTEMDPEGRKEWVVVTANYLQKPLA
jgi:hypothetical protein